MKSLIYALNTKTERIYFKFNPWNNVIGLARTFFGLALLVLLVFNPMKNIFLKSSDSNHLSKDNFLNIFSYLPDNYLYFEIIRWLFILILILVVIGWRPKITAIPHVYIAYCINSGGMVIDGGEQVGYIFALLLLPILLFDKRKWHWENRKPSKSYSNLLAYVTYVFIRIQVAIIYLHSFSGKIYNDDWINGTAVYYYLNDPMLGSMPILDFIIEPILQSPLIALITWVALIIQLVLVCGLFLDKKYWNIMFWFAILFHESIAIFLGLFTFSLAMVGALIIYLHPLDKEFKFNFIKKFLTKGKENEI
ncbi:sporulation-delaying protein SdpB family protein [Staphylococcus pseudoxylosus]|uniref:sporulation-delaying protein SdpB family protein n=1 Tax=Staphylococcus pseudoxylosus TaxID=2282419 RepID=UPI00398A75EF